MYKIKAVSNRARIGFFDSGLGGLLILKAVAKHLPEYDYEYYGDTKHVPYGDRTEEEIYQLTKAGVEHLFDKGSILVIIACNTASAETLRRLQDEFLPLCAYPDRKILGVIIPIVEEVVASEASKVLMFATQRTVSSGKYHLELGKRNELNTKIEALATPEFVPLIESGKSIGVFALMQALIDERIEGTGLDGVILGCTHYTLLTQQLKDAYGDSLCIFSQTEIVPKKLKIYLQNHPEIETKLSREGTRNVFLTEHNTEYDAHIATLLEGQFLSE